MLNVLLQIILHETGNNQLGGPLPGEFRNLVKLEVLKAGTYKSH